jgi:hypothetical protein
MFLAARGRSHSVCTVGRAQWVGAPLPAASARAPPAKADSEGLERLRDFTVNGMHFYSETCDLTRPYPSPRPVLGCRPRPLPHRPPPTARRPRRARVTPCAMRL